MSARFFSSIGGFRIQTETTEIKLTEEEGKQILRDALKFLEGTTPGVIAPESRVWVEEEEG